MSDPDDASPQQRTQEADRAGRSIVTRDDVAVAGPGSLPPIWLRVVARVIDAIVSELPLVAWAFAAGYVRTAGGQIELDAPGWFLVVSTVVPVLYEWIAVGVSGRTPGKVAVGLRIARVADGGRPTWQQSAFRVLVPTVPEFVRLGLANPDSTLGFVLSTAGMYVYLTSLFHPLGRGMHDRAAGTVVLRSR